jgi:DNA polymerase-1
VKKYQEELLEGARASGYVSTISGRKRFMEGINSSNRNIREFAERAAINAPIQGTAADIIKLAMISINEEFKKSGFGAKMILQVHDELVFSAAKREAEAVKDAVRKIMESAVKIRVPLTVTMGQGENWYECG